MTIGKWLLSYGLTTIVFFAVDIVWLGFVARKMYREQLAHILADSTNWAAAIIFYLLFVVGIMVFAIVPAVNEQSVMRAVLLGAFFGFITYATYDLTNLATVKDWPISVTIIDMIWGSVLVTVVSVAGYYIMNFIK